MPSGTSRHYALEGQVHTTRSTRGFDYILVVSYPRPTPTLPKPHYPLPRTKLAPPFAPHQPFQNRTIPLAFRRGVGLPLPLHRPPPSPQPSQKDNNPSPCTTTLASLVKGRWLDGTTQTVALLRPTCDISALFILQTFLPSRRMDCLSCIDPLHPHNHCKKTIVPCSALNSPPLSNGGAVAQKNLGDYRRDCFPTAPFPFLRHLR